MKFKTQVVNLLMDITFDYQGHRVTVPKNEMVVANLEEGYAIWNGFYFDIFPGEYSFSS